MSENPILSVYAAYSLDELERVKSSSGGLFSLMARQVLSTNGVVYGVAMSEDCRRAEFYRVANEAELEKLRTSKYLQANVGDTFRNVKKDLVEGLIVLFSGTGCQINGLVSYLAGGRNISTVQSQYPNLYCVDVICHGIPSPALWRKYVEDIEKQVGSKLIGINFRCKDNHWIDSGINEIHTQDGDDKRKEFYISKDEDPYMLMFLRDYCLRPSCYECIAKQHKLSDITIADFWGISEVLPKMNDGKGVSLVISRTAKGSELFNRIKSSVVYKDVTYKDGVRRNSAEYCSAKRPAERDIFFDDMTEMNFEELKAKYGMPAHLSLKRKIKKAIKKLILKTPASKFIKEDNVNRYTYGVLFTFEEERHGKKDN